MSSEIVSTITENNNRRNKHMGPRSTSVFLTRSSSGQTECRLTNSSKLFNHLEVVRPRPVALFVDGYLADLVSDLTLTLDLPVTSLLWCNGFSCNGLSWKLH